MNEEKRRSFFIEEVERKLTSLEDTLQPDEKFAYTQRFNDVEADVAAYNEKFGFDEYETNVCRFMRKAYNMKVILQKCYLFSSERFHTAVRLDGVLVVREIHDVHELFEELRKEFENILDWKIKSRFVQTIH